MKYGKRIRKHENCILALIFTIANMILMGICFDFYYDLNDDTMMHDIMAGVYSGTPDGHNMQTLYPLGALIALCYRVCGSVSWYGLFLCLCQFGCFCLAGARLCALCGGTIGAAGQNGGAGSASAAGVAQDNVSSSAVKDATCRNSVPERSTAGESSRHMLRKCAALLCLSLYLWSVCLSHLINIQYTITCAILSAAAIFLFLTTPAGLNTRQFVVKNVPSVILVVLSYQLRSEMLLLTFPLICLAGLYRLTEEREIFRKENLGKYGAVLGMILAGMALSLAVDKSAYGSAQWKDFRDFFDARTTVYDFYQELITGEEYSGALTELGVEPYQQTLLRNYNFGLDETIDTRLLSDLADYAVHTIGMSKDWRAIFREKSAFYRYRILHSGDAPYNVMVLWAYAAVFLAGALAARRPRAAIGGQNRGGAEPAEKNNGRVYERAVGQKALRRYSFVWQLLLLAAVRTALWMFILMRGRDPERITHSLYLAEFALLMGMLVCRLQAGRNGLDDAAGGGADGETQDNAVIGARAVFAGTILGKGMARGMAALAGLILVGALTDSVPAVREDQRQRELVNQDRDAIDAYCRERKENFYFEDVYSTVAFSRRLFDGSDNSYANYDIMGGWMCKSPLYREKLRRSGIDNADEALCTQNNVYFIMSDAEKEERGLEWIAAYYAAHNIEVTVEQVETVGESGRYHVYSIGSG